MNKHLRPYGDTSMSSLVAKFGMKKTPDLELSNKRILGVERIGPKSREV